MFVVTAGDQMVRVFRRADVLPAHVALSASILVSLLQFVVAVEPGEWRDDLYRGGLLIYVSGVLLFYAARSLLHIGGQRAKTRA